MKKVQRMKLWIVSMVMVMLFLGCPKLDDLLNQPKPNGENPKQKVNSKKTTFEFQHKKVKVQFPEIYGGKQDVFVQRLIISPGVDAGIPIKISVKKLYVNGIDPYLTIDGSEDAVVYNAEAPLKLEGLMPGVFTIIASKASASIDGQNSIEEASYLLMVDAGSMKDAFFGPITLEKKYSSSDRIFSFEEINKAVSKVLQDLSGNNSYELGIRPVSDDGDLAVQWNSTDKQFDIRKIGSAAYNFEFKFKNTGLKKYTTVVFKVTPADVGQLSVNDVLSKEYDPSGKFTSEEIKAAVTGDFTTKPGFEIQSVQKLSAQDENGNPITVLKWNGETKSLEIKNAGTATYRVTFGAVNYASGSVSITFKVAKAPMGKLLQLNSSHVDKYVKGKSYTHAELLAMIKGVPAGAKISNVKVQSGTSVKVMSKAKLVHATYGESKVLVTLDHPNYKSQGVVLKFHIFAQLSKKPEQVKLDMYNAPWGTEVKIKDYGVAKYEYDVSPPKAYDVAKGTLKLDKPGDVSIRRRVKASAGKSPSMLSDAVRVAFTKREQGDLEIEQSKGKQPWTKKVNLSLMKNKEGTGSGPLMYTKVSATADGAGVTSDGIVVANGPGDVVVQVTKAADDKYKEKTSGVVTVSFGKAAMSANVKGILQTPEYKARETYSENKLLEFIENEPVGTSVKSVRLSSGKTVTVANNEVTHKGIGQSVVEVRLTHAKYTDKTVTIDFDIRPVGQGKPAAVKVSSKSAPWGTEVKIKDYDVAKYEYDVSPPKAYDVVKGTLKLDKPGDVSIRRRVKASAGKSPSMLSDAVRVAFTKRDQDELEIAQPAKKLWTEKVQPAKKPWTEKMKLSLVKNKEGTGSGLLVYNKVSATADGAGVTSDGIVVANGPGDVVVQVTKAADDKYKEKTSGVVTVSFGKAVMNIKSLHTVAVNYSGRSYNKNDILNMFIEGEPTGTSITQIKPVITETYSPTAIVMAGTTLQEFFDVKNLMSVYNVVLSHPDYHDKEVTIVINMKFFMSSSGLKKRTDKDVFYTGRAYDKDDMLQLFVEDEPQGTKITKIRKISGTDIKMATKTIFQQFSAGGGVNLFEFTLSHPDYPDETVEAGITVRRGKMPPVSQEPTSKVIQYSGGKIYNEKDILDKFIAGESPDTSIKKIEKLSLGTAYGEMKVYHGTSLKEGYADAGRLPSKFRITLSRPNYIDAEVEITIQVHPGDMSVTTKDISVTYDPKNPYYTFADILANNIEGEPAIASVSRVNVNNRGGYQYTKLNLANYIGSNWVKVILVDKSNTFSYHNATVQFKLTVNKYTPPAPPRPQFLYSGPNDFRVVKGNAKVMIGIGQNSEYKLDRTVAPGARQDAQPIMQKLIGELWEVSLDKDITDYIIVSVRVRNHPTFTSNVSPWSEPLKIKFMPKKCSGGGRRYSCSY